MSANSVTFTGAINQAAAAAGRAPTPEQVERLNLELQTFALLDDETRTVSVTLDDGTLVGINTFLDGAVAKFPAAALATAPDPAGWVKVSIGTSTGYRRADDRMIQIMAGIEAGQAADTAREAATWSNPWRAGKGFNRTRQAILTNTNPELAARYKSEAGIR